MTGCRAGTLRVALLAVGAATVAAAGSVRGQTIQAGDLTLELGGRVQVQYGTTSLDAEDVVSGAEAPAETAFEIRRLYLGVEVTFEDWITGVLEADFSGEPELKDGYIDLALADGLGVRAGQFKKPFGLIELTSSTVIPTIERGLRIRGVEDLPGLPAEEQFLLTEGLFAGRQIGVMVHGAAGRLGYAAGVFNGEGANTGEVEGSKAYAARLTYALPVPLVLGGAVSAQPVTALGTVADEEHAVAWSVDAEWGGFRQPGLRLLAEAMLGDDPLLLPGTNADMAGAQAMAGWFVPLDGRVEGVEPALRVSWGDPNLDAGDDSALLFTPGINLYFSGRNRFQINADIYDRAADGADPVYAIVTQLQIYF